MTVPFETTVIGSLPKPRWLYDSSAFSTNPKQIHGKGGAWAYSGEKLREAQDDATRLAIGLQESADLDEISDGEQRRESYLSYVVRKLEGFDYETFGEKVGQGWPTPRPGRPVHGLRVLARPHAPGRPALHPRPFTRAGQGHPPRPHDRLRLHPRRVLRRREVYGLCRRRCPEQGSPRFN